MSKKKSLESIVKRQAKDNHVKHFDPIDAISHHVVLVIFISVLFLFGLLMFFTMDQAPESATAYAILEYKDLAIHKDLTAGISNFIQTARQSEDRPLILLTLYTFWIVIFGLINMALYERNINKEHKRNK